jgi:hypothetical protein
VTTASAVLKAPTQSQSIAAITFPTPTEVRHE